MTEGFLPLGCLLIAGTKLVQVLSAMRQRNELDTERHHESQRGCRSRSSAVTTTVVGTATSFILLVCPSIIVESVGLVVGVETLTDSQLDVYQTVVVLLYSKSSLSVFVAVCMCLLLLL